ncbi:protein transport protein Sec16A-like isoform X2 [Mytilus edulis]|uniref:protein transport protein Sec16A-like isoform X2 n=1 Tax=Mytilus edulis TaxID=6550 RepID=UPI0039EEA34B
MSITNPWNSGAEGAKGNVKLFNPAEFHQNGPSPQTDGTVTDHKNQSSWSQGWGNDNHYGQYNGQQSDQGLGQQGQVHYQGPDQNSQQFYNLNPGIPQQQSYNQDLSNDHQGQPFQSYDPGQAQSFQPYDPNQAQQYDPNQAPAVQQFDQQGQPIQQLNAEAQAFQPYGSQAYQNYDDQGQYNNQNYEWNQYNYGYQQGWNNTEADQQPPGTDIVESGQNPDLNVQSDSQSQNVNNENYTNTDSTELYNTNASNAGKVNNELGTSGGDNQHIASSDARLSKELDPNSHVPQPDISSESLVTLNSSSTQLVEDNVQSIENQMGNMYVEEKSNESDRKVEDINHSAIEGQGSSVDGNPKVSTESKDSPVNSQTSDDWELVPSDHNLLAPSNHSRQGSTDSSANVQFFIGSTNISPSETPNTAETGHTEKKPAEGSPPHNLIPKHSSSPMPPRNNIAESTGPPSVSINQPPPTGLGPSGGNPFRKGKGSDNRTSRSPNILKNNEHVSQPVTISQNEGLKLDIKAADSGFPSPIQPVTEDSQDPPTQSPIMPRKESPFQPPRRRNLSQSSNSFDDENISDPRHVGGSASDHHQSNIDRKSGDRHDRKTGPMKADRTIGSILPPQSAGRQKDSSIDYSRFSNRGIDEKRPRSPLSSSRSISDRLTPTKPPTGRTTPTKSSNGRTTPGRNTPSRRMEHAAYQRAIERRKKENISPATSLWANNDIVPKSNILLAPAAPMQATSTTPVFGIVAPKGSGGTREVLSPVQNLITSMSDHLSRENSPEKDTSKLKTNERDRRESTQRDRHERNSSIDREIEMTKRMEDRERVLENSRERSYKDDRNYRGTGQDDRYKDERYRETRDYRDRDREREYERERQIEAHYQRNNKARDSYYSDDRYERSRSRQSTIDDRPQDQSFDKSRYDRDAYSRDKYGRGYYDYYGTNKQYGYYDQRYADYYGDARYSKAYYDEYYNGQYPEKYYDQYGRHDDTYSQRSGSRVHTPLSDSGEQPAGYPASRSSSRQGYEDYHNRQYDPYYYGYQDYYNNSYAEPEPPGRMTPEKYTLPHMCARFGPGGHLIKVMPNRPKEGQTATVEIHDISMMLEDRPEVEELKCFPGPLVRGDTHKNDVLSFCQQKAKACSENINMTDRDSAELIWKLLEVLIKQNGMIIGTDIADLLLAGHEPTTVEYSIMGMKISSSMDNLDDLDETNDISTVTMDRSVVNKQRSREEVTDRFRHLLLYGRKKDALEWAMKNNLWGHALFLASKMDTKAHANVMTRFANSAMKMNDPLQTLFQLMSGRQPAAVSCITDEKWGDWRPHLAMMLSNQTHKADLDRKCIMTMGDTLASRGFLHASHFCYLMAQAGFGSYHKKTSKMVLIGSNHSLSLSEFATSEAIQCSEVYEYAMSLGNSSFFSPNLQYFKYLYACRMAESGFAQQALEYCEVIAKFINISPTVFQPTLVKLVYELASRLKKFDPEQQQVGEDAEDPMWLQNLYRINQGYEDGSIQPLSGSVTPYCFTGTRSSSASGEVAGLTEMNMMQSGHYTGSSPYPQGQGQQMYNQGYSVDQTQNQMYASEQTQYQGNVTNQVQNQGTPDPMQNQSQHGEHVENQGYNGDQSQGYQTGQQQQTVDQGQTYQSQGYTDQGQVYQNQQVNYQQNQQYTAQEGQTGYQYQPHDLASVPETTNQNQEYNTENQTGETTTYQPPPLQQQQQHYSQPNDFSMYHNAGLQSEAGHRNSMSSIGTVSSHADTDDEEGLGHSQKNDFDYFGAATNTQKIVPPRLRKRTESESSQVNNSTSKSSSEPSTKTETKSDLSGKKNQGQSKGWFGGVFSKLLPKSKNEMKLPDDSKPSIVWDPVKKKWMNQDGEEEDEKPPPPPPKDMDLSSSAAPMPSSSAPTPALGPPAGNRYGRQRGRGARTQYVDVMNPKSSTGGTASVPSNIFNVMPTSASSPAIFSPSHSKDTPVSSQPEVNLAQPNDPPSMPSDQRIHTGETESTEMPPPSSGPPSMPMLFNPSQISSSSATKPGLKRYNQQRLYPKS